MEATILLILLHFYGLGYEFIKDGKERETKYNYRSRFISTVIFFVLYYYTGVFDNL